MYDIGFVYLIFIAILSLAFLPICIIWLIATRSQEKKRLTKEDWKAGYREKQIK